MSPPVENGWQEKNSALQTRNSILPEEWTPGKVCLWRKAPSIASKKQDPVGAVLEGLESRILGSIAERRETHYHGLCQVFA